MKVFVVAAAVLGFACDAQQNAGIAASFSQGGTQYLLEQLIPVLEKDFGSLSIPTIPFDQDGFEGSVSNIVCKSFTIGAGNIIMSAPSTLGAQLSNIAVSCTANWDFKLKSWPHVPSGSGSVDISVSDTSATVDVALGVSPTGHATMGCPAGCASISIGNISMTFHGSAWDWLLNLVKSLLTSSIKSAISDNFSSVISSLVSTDGNAFLAGIPTEIPIPVRAPYNISEVRFGLTQAPAVTSTYAGVYLQGDVVPVASPTPPSGVPPPSLPPFEPSAGASYVQLLLSPYTLLTAVGTYVDAGLTVFPISPSDIPLGLNTSDSPAWSLIAPGMAKAFPPSTPIAIQASITGLPSANITPAGIAAAVPATFVFSGLPGTPPSPSPAFTLATNISMSLDLTVGGQAGAEVITGNLTYLDADLALVSSAVGTVNVGLLSGLVSLTVNGVILPTVNDLLKAGLPLPQAPGLQLTGTQVDYANGYAVLQSNFTFTPPGLSVMKDGDGGAAVSGPAAAPALNLALHTQGKLRGA